MNAMGWYTIKLFERPDPRTTAGVMIDSAIFEATDDGDAKAQARERSLLAVRGDFAALFAPGDDHRPILTLERDGFAYARGGSGDGETAGSGPSESRDVIRLINAVVDQQISGRQPVAVLHLTDADWQAVRAFKERFPEVAPAHGEPTDDDPRPRYRLIPIARSFRRFSFAELAPQMLDGGVSAPWIPIDSPKLTAGVGPFGPQADRPPNASMGADYDRNSVGNELTDSNGDAITGSGGNPIGLGARADNAEDEFELPSEPQAFDVKVAEAAEATDSLSAELVRPAPPDATQLPGEAPASLTFTTVNGRIAVSSDPPGADLPPDALAEMFEAARASANEATDTLKRTNADKRLIEHLERFRDLLGAGKPTQMAIFRIGKESSFLRRCSNTLRDEGNDFAADALDALGDYLDGCANQFPVWVTFTRNDLAARLSAEDVEHARGIARLLAAGLGHAEALVDPNVPDAFKNLAGDEGIDESEPERRRRAADILGGVRNFIKEVRVTLAATVFVESAKGLLELLLVNPDGGTTIINFVVNAPGWSPDPMQLIAYLRQLAIFLGLPII
jgi:hypothetical protein